MCSSVTLIATGALEEGLVGTVCLAVSKDFLYCVVLFSRILSLKYFDFALEIRTTAVFLALCTLSWLVCYSWHVL